QEDRSRARDERIPGAAGTTHLLPDIASALAWLRTAAAGGCCLDIVAIARRRPGTRFACNHSRPECKRLSVTKDNLRCPIIAKIASLSTHTRPHFRRSLSIEEVSLWARGNHVNLGEQEVGTSDQASCDLMVSGSGTTFGKSEDGGLRWSAEPKPSN